MITSASASSTPASPTDQYDFLFKLLLVGDSGVGKTSLLLRFTANSFSDTIRNTVGVDLKVKMVKMNGAVLKLTVWDTAGQERFRTLTSAYYRGAHGVILVYDITARSSFDALSHWLNEIDIYSTNDETVRMLIGNKSDCDQTQRQVTREQGNAFARQHNMLFIEASAKTKEGVQTAFDELIYKILELQQEKQQHSSGAGGTPPNAQDRTTQLLRDDEEPAPPSLCCLT